LKTKVTIALRTTDYQSVVPLGAEPVSA